MKKFRDGFELFLISLIILFLELAGIRWFPAHVLYLTFFTNVVLLACFLGMSVGCLAANQRRNYLTWTPVLLVVALAVALGLSYFHFLLPRRRFRIYLFFMAPLIAFLLLVVVWLAAYTLIHDDYQGQREAQQLWSPYYRIDFTPRDLSLSVNLIYHQ